MELRRAGTPTQLPHFIGPTVPKIWVSEMSALQLSTVWACVNVISKSMSVLPWRVYELQDDGDREIAENDPTDYLLHTAPNPEMNPADWVVAMNTTGDLWGNCYSYIERNGRFDPIALWPVHASRVTVRRTESDRLYYEVRDERGVRVDVPPDDMFHVKGMTLDGVIGLNTIDGGREAIALGIAAERFGAAFYGNALRPSGTVEVPVPLKDKAYRRLRAAWRKKAGAGNAGTPLILEQGAVWKSIGITPDEGQHNETRKEQVREICRFFGLTPRKIGDLEYGESGNVEHDEMVFVGDAIVPRAVRYEQEANRKLISAANRFRRFTKMNVRGLLRGDMKTQADAWGRQMLAGFVTRNEIRELMDLNREDDGFGDRYWKPVNMGWADEPTPVNAPQAGPGSEQTGSAAEPQQDQGAGARAIRQLIVSQLTTARRREEKARARQVGKDSFPQWADKFYGEQQAHIAEALNAALSPFVGVMLPKGDTITKHCRDAAALYAANVLAVESDGWESASLAAIETTADKLTGVLFGTKLVRSETTTTRYDVGTRVRVKPGKNHDEETMDAEGPIVEISTPALAVKFDGMDEPHKWYVDDEVMVAE